MAKPVFEAQTGETVFAEKVAVDCWKTPGQAVGRQVSGKGYFTDKRIVLPSLYLPPSRMVSRTPKGKQGGVMQVSTD